VDNRSLLQPVPCRWLAALLIGAATLGRLVWLATCCQLDLAPDEAHYWDWSRHLDWSYYSKGPGIAWLIRLSCDLFGGLSTRLTGTEMLAVRLPAVLCGGLLLTALYLLTVQVFQREALALVAVALGLTTPAFAAGSSLMTIDAPYTCCWGWALVFTHRAVFKGHMIDWTCAGLTIGLGILFKYTMVVFVPSLLLFLLLTPPCWPVLRSRGLLLLLVLTAACCVPILVWNAEHEWVTFRHVGGLAGVNAPATRIDWLGPARFVVVQASLWLVFWFVVWVRAMWCHAPWREERPGVVYLWWMSAPMIGLFFLCAFKTGGGEPNWPVTGYLSGFVLGMAWMAGELRRAQGWYRRVSLAGLALACLAGLVLTVVIHHSALVYPVLKPLVGTPTALQPFPMRRLDPTLRLRGWRLLADEVDAVRRDLTHDDVEPVLAGTGWNMPGLLGFYCAGHPPVYSLGLPLGDRRSQYDFWRPNPVWDATQFSGRTFVIVANCVLDLKPAFEHVEVARTVTCHVAGQPVAVWYIHRASGYRGFMPGPASAKQPNY
jgi:4-amino-4-deoxy-L-arabinose transferase-like glycosyltransferase